MAPSLPAPLSPVVSTPVAPVKPPWYSPRRLGYNFLTLSIVLHLLFGVVAASLIVATFVTKKKPDFLAPGSKGPSAATRALEHKVSMAKKQNTMSAPPNAKRVTTTGVTKVALPAMPSMPKMDMVLPAAMSGMTGNSAGLGGFGAGGGSGGGGGGGGGGGLSLFGMRNRTGGSLVGRLYDLKQDKNRRPTNMDNDRYAGVVRQFIQGGFNMVSLASYYQATVPLYATQMFTPTIGADEAPKSFGVQMEVQPKLWMAVYSGKVIPTESGNYRFMGFGDDMLVVRFNHQVVLDSGYLNPSGVRPSKLHHYDFEAGTWYREVSHNAGHGEGTSFTVEAGKSYDMEVVVGEQPGGVCMFQLLIMKDGVTYKEDANHNPICPVFRLVGSAPIQASSKYPPFDPEGPIWKAEMPPIVAPPK